jgi:OmcA/MtrC family decaheme c-type cytochrome
MIHKIHMGVDLPSVQATNTTGPNTGDPVTPYYIVGNQGSIHDYSAVAFPNHDGVQHCTTCHSGEDKDNWKTKPNAAACTSCHDNVRFEQPATGTLPSCSALGTQTPPLPAYSPCLHSGGPITFASAAARNSSAQCVSCHGPTGPNPVEGANHHGD